MRKYLLAAVLASTAIGGVAIAAQTAPQTAPVAGQHHGRHHGGGMMRMDTNKDGVITRDEAIAAATKRFDKMDANHDGRIDQAEMSALHEKRQAKRAEWRAKRMAQPQGQGQTPPPASAQ